MQASEKAVVLYITTKDRNVNYELLGDQNIKTLAAGLTLTSGGGTINESIDSAQTYTIIVTFAEYAIVQAAVDLLVDYIYEKLRTKAETTLKVGQASVRIDKGEIRNVILHDLELTQK